MLHTNLYQRPRPCTFRQEDFLSFFSYKVYVKHVGHGAGPFLAPGL